MIFSASPISSFLSWFSGFSGFEGGRSLSVGSLLAVGYCSSESILRAQECRYILIISMSCCFNGSSLGSALSASGPLLLFARSILHILSKDGELSGDGQFVFCSRADSRSWFPRVSVFSPKVKSSLDLKRPRSFKYASLRRFTQRSNLVPFKLSSSYRSVWAFFGLCFLGFLGDLCS